MAALVETLRNKLKREERLIGSARLLFIRLLLCTLSLFLSSLYTCKMTSCFMSRLIRAYGTVYLPPPSAGTLPGRIPIALLHEATSAAVPRTSWSR